MEYKIGTDARCAVIGYGSWATAIVGLLAANGRRVGWYVRNPEVLESLCSDGRNPRYLNDLEFDRNSIAPSSDLDAVVRDADIVILATPSAYLKDFLAPLTVPLTSYVARHGWASIARSRNIPLAIISEAMGHDSEKTTRIYLASLDTTSVDKANSRILKAL